MIFDKVNLDHKYKAVWGYHRKMVPPKRLIKVTDIPGRNGALVSDGESYEDAQFTYECWIPIKREIDRRYIVRNFYNDISRGHKVEISDPRDNGLSFDAVLTDFKSEPKFINPLYEKCELEFSVSPFFKGIEQEFSLSESYENKGDKPVDFVADLVVTSSQLSSLRISDETHSANFIDINITLNAGNKVHIDTALGYISVNNNNALKYMSYLSDFFMLEVGRSKLVANGCSGVIKFREEFLIG